MSNRHKHQHLMQSALPQKKHHPSELFIVTESEHHGHRTVKSTHVKIGRHGVEQVHVKKPG
jgi:hypothetical protein